MTILQSEEGKTFAYKNENGEEVVLGETVYLGKNDTADRYYQVDKPTEGNDDRRNYAD